MNKSIDELIGEIRGLTNGRMDATQQEKILEEVRTHLDAGIQARLELGVDPRVAEQESISAFGNARLFVDQLSQTGEAKGSPFDSGVAIALLLSILLTAVAFTAAPPLPAYACMVAGGALTAWRSWKAPRLQVAPICSAFLAGIPIYSACNLIDSHSHSFRMDWAQGIYASAFVVGILGLISLISWLFASILRGSIGREYRALKSEENSALPRVIDGIALGVVAAVAIAVLAGESLSDHDFPFQAWAGFALATACCVTVIQGWRTRVLALRNLILASTISLPIALIGLSQVYVSLYGEVVPRSQVAEWIHYSNFDPRTTEQQRIELFASTLTKEFAGHSAPFKIPVSSTTSGQGAGYRTATTRAEAMQLVEQLKAHELRKLNKNDQAFNRIVAYSKRAQREETAILNAPLVTNAIKLVPLALSKAWMVWCILAAAHGFAAAARRLIQRNNFPRRGLA